MNPRPTTGGDIKELLGYEGKTVVITGAASGIAYCATELLISLGAKVYATVNSKPCDLPVASVRGNLSVKAEIVGMTGQIDREAAQN